MGLVERRLARLVVRGSRLRPSLLERHPVAPSAQALVGMGSCTAAPAHALMLRLPINLVHPPVRPHPETSIASCHQALSLVLLPSPPPLAHRGPITTTTGGPGVDPARHRGPRQ